MLLRKRVGAQTANVAEQAIDFIGRELLLLRRGLFPLILLLFKDPMALWRLNFQALRVEGGESKEILVTQVRRILLKLGQEIGLEAKDRIQRGVDGIVTVAVLLAQHQGLGASWAGEFYT